MVREMARPSPVPGMVRASGLVERWKAEKRWTWSWREMPEPGVGRPRPAPAPSSAWTGRRPARRAGCTSRRCCRGCRRPWGGPPGRRCTTTGCLRQRPAGSRPRRCRPGPAASPTRGAAQLGEVHRDALELAAALDAGVVEEVGHQPVEPRALRAMASTEVGCTPASSSSSVWPMIEVSGVLSSWQMVAISSPL